MRFTTLTAVAAATLMASPALAQDDAWYVGLNVGVINERQENVDVGVANNSAIQIDHEYGYDGALFVGYDLGAFRIEAEVAYKSADLAALDTAIALPDAPGAPFNPPGFYTEPGGSSSALSFMINGMLDFGDDDGISGFVGGGVGMARVKANNYRNFANATPFLDGSDSQLAWQIFAGVRQQLSDNIDLTARYRFFNVDGLNFDAFNGQQADLTFQTHSVLIGIELDFGPGRLDDPM